MDLAEVFGPQGALARVLPGWEPRPHQEEMAAAVAKALERGDSLVVEAGTGVGKSLAYLIPAALWAARGGRRVLVSTHTRALQEQLLERELPVVARALRELGLPLRFAMLMGADNYLCVQRLERLLAKPGAAAPKDEQTLALLGEWARTASTGHRSSLPALVPQGLWSRLARDSDLCRGPGGPYWDRCLWRLDRERAERAQILVVNHALLLSGARLPSCDAMIIDEAHNLEEAAVSRYGREASLPGFTALCADARAAGEEPGLSSLLAAADAALAALRVFFQDAARAHGLLGPDDEVAGRLLERELPPLPPELPALEAALAEAAALQESLPGGEDLRALHARAVQDRQNLAAILEGESPSDARWIAWPARGPELRSAPLDAGARLAAGLFSRGVPAVLTSATLSTGDGLKDFKSRAGLPEARELVLGSPYDYRSQAALWCVPGVPDPVDDPAYARALAAQCARVIAAVPGGVFVLFSNWKTLKKVHALLRRRVKNRPVWAQGQSGHEALLEQFAAAGDAVLLGVDTFWQGVDVPGPALSCVILTKLPFPNVGSPIEEARRRWLESEEGDYFRDWSLPKAVMKFRQGFGRLIRSASDRGAVVCLDSRLLRKGYGRAFLNALPPCRRLESLEELEAFFAPASRSV